jgi:hypothetical protein
MVEEGELQKKLIFWCGLLAKVPNNFEGSRLKLFEKIYHIPNGGTRSIPEAVNLKAQGVRPGVADLFLSVPSLCKTIHGLYIEMKSEEGTQSEDQKKFESFVLSQGYGYKLCNTTEKAMQAMIQYLYFPYSSTWESQTLRITKDKDIIKDKVPRKLFLLFEGFITW